LVICNDPYHAGSHIPDLNTLSPIFDGDELVGFTVTKAHHADLGGKVPGSMPGDAREIYEEGLRVPPVRLYEQGRLNEGIFQLLLWNSRTPKERQGDLRAQIAANRLGEQRLVELLRKKGRRLVLRYFEAVMTYAARRMRRVLAGLPHGRFEGEDFLDDDGVGGPPIRIHVAVTLSAQGMAVDYTGSDGVRPSAINCSMIGPVTAAYYVARCVTDPEIPANDGFYRCVEVQVPRGTFFNPEPPAACTGIAEVTQRCIDALLAALAPVLPRRVPAACCSTMHNTHFGGLDPRPEANGRAYTYYETIGGGYGARPDRDGIDGVQTHGTNTKNTPIEALEIAYPLRVEEYALIPNSDGAGQFRGGLGIRRVVRVIGHEAVFSELADRHVFPPWGLFGGAAGMRGRVTVYPPSGEPFELPSKTSRRLPPETVVVVETPGGGGYGLPRERDRERVAADVTAEKVSRRRAEGVYRAPAT
jgi:N-methylhydantoinase B